LADDKIGLAFRNEGVKKSLEANETSINAIDNVKDATKLLNKITYARHFIADAKTALTDNQPNQDNKIIKDSLKVLEENDLKLDKSDKLVVSALKDKFKISDSEINKHKEKVDKTYDKVIKNRAKVSEITKTSILNKNVVEKTDDLLKISPDLNKPPNLNMK